MGGGGAQQAPAVQNTYQPPNSALDAVNQLQQSSQGLTSQASSLDQALAGISNLLYGTSSPTFQSTQQNLGNMTQGTYDWSSPAAQSANSDLANQGKGLYYGAMPVLSNIEQQGLSQLNSGGIGSNVPVVQGAVNQSKAATSSTLKQLQDQLNSSGLGGSPFALNQIATSQMQGNQASNQAGYGAANWLLNALPTLSTTATGQGTAATNQAAGNAITSQGEAISGQNTMLSNIVATLGQALSGITSAASIGGALATGQTSALTSLLDALTGAAAGTSSAQMSSQAQQNSAATSANAAKGAAQLNFLGKGLFG